MSDELIERLRTQNGMADREQAAATIESLQSTLAATLERVKVLEEERSTVWKWIERGLFDNSIPANNALGVLAHSPYAPWSDGRWDVDHKPYAAKFYKTFPEAALSEQPNDGGQCE